MNRLRYANLLESVSTEEILFKSKVEQSEIFSPGGQAQGQKKDFSDPRSKNPRFFPPEGKPKVEKRTFQTQGRTIRDLFPPEGKPKVEKGLLRPKVEKS